MQTVERQQEPRQQDINIVLHWIGKLVFRALGWRIVGEIPGNPKFVAAMAPHTSNMDGFMLIMTSWVLRIRFDWMIKVEWTRGPIGAFLRYFGAIGIDRSASFDTVEQMVRKFNERDHLLLAIPPEGTRRHTNYWRTGFYWIAHQANVPILPVPVDYQKKTVDISAPLLQPTGDIEADMEVLWAYFEGVQGHYPENFSDRRLRPSAIRANQRMEEEGKTDSEQQQEEQT